MDNSWVGNIDGSWTVGADGVLSVGMRKSSPQLNGCSFGTRVGKVSGVPGYLGWLSSKVSNKTLEEGAVDKGEGGMRFGATPEPWPLNNSAPTKSRLIWKAG